MNLVVKSELSEIWSLLVVLSKLLFSARYVVAFFSPPAGVCGSSFRLVVLVSGRGKACPYSGGGEFRSADRLRGFVLCRFAF